MGNRAKRCKNVRNDERKTKTHTHRHTHTKQQSNKIDKHGYQQNAENVEK